MAVMTLHFAEEQALRSGRGGVGAAAMRCGRGKRRRVRSSGAETVVFRARNGVAFVRYRDDSGEALIPRYEFLLSLQTELDLTPMMRRCANIHIFFVLRVGACQK
jgi:hypothetical protein